MTKKTSVILGFAAFAALTMFAAVRAQDAAAPEEPTAASGGEGKAAAPAVPVKPTPSEMAPLAAEALMLGIANTGKHLVAVGDRGNILASNNGKDWAQVQTPVQATLTSVEFVDENSGWAVGHDAVVLHTGDGGKTWQIQNFQPDLGKPLLDTVFLDAQRGFAVGAYGLMLTTTDGGTSWNEVTAAPVREEEMHLNSIAKLGGGDLFLVGESGMMGVSKDGQTWTRLTAPYDGSLYGILARGDKGALVYGMRGNVYTTDDVRSNKWKKIDTGTVASMFGGTALPSGGIAMVGLAGEVLIIGADGAIRHTRIKALASVTGSGTLAAAIPWQGGLLAVGELGVSPVGL